MSPTDDLVPILKKLRLSGVLQTLELRTRQAVEDDLAHPEYLYRVLLDEVERRDQKQLDMRLRRAAFEAHKTVEDFDFTFNPAVPKAKVIDLATCAFVKRKEVVMLLGQAGVGKSHIAQAIGHRACMQGHTVLYTSASTMLTVMRAARADQSYDRKLLRYTTPELLIVDDVGLRPLRDFEAEDLFEVIRQRYERGATIWTSNRSEAEWYAMFGDELLASAAMDRLLHYATTVEITGESFRNPRARRRVPVQES
jgi:DNA replication protein DnaC